MIGSILSVGSSMAVGMEGPLVMIGAYAGATLAHCGTTLSSIILKVIHLKHRCQQQGGNNGFITGCLGFLFSNNKKDKNNNNNNHNNGSSSNNRGSDISEQFLDDFDIDSNSSPILHSIWIWSTSDLSYFANDAERRKLITIGAACGFAASFGAPIGGMLFILDDISTFFDQDMFLRILVANSVGTFCLALYRGDLSYYGAIQFGSYTGSEDNNISDRFLEIPWWIVLGVIFGILGGGFCKAFGAIKKSTGKQFNTKGLKLLRITYISLINSVVMFLLPSMSWVCHDNIDVYGNNSTTTAASAEQQFFCDEGQTNEMATVFFGSRGKAIVRILSNPGQFYPLTLFIVGIVFYVLMLYTNTTSIPSGLFTPIVISGAALGGSYGLLLKQYVDENVDPSSFALLGVGAMMAGIQRSTVSTCVILVEGTGQMKVLLPVMIVVVVSNYVAYLVHEDGIYEVLIKLKGYPYLEHGKDDLYDVFTVSEVMSTPPVVVREKERASKLVKILKSTTHNGFPVVDDRGRFKGLVRRKQIVALMECGIFEQVGPGDDAITMSIKSSSGSINTSGRSATSTRSGMGGLQGLMHYAFHIKDDRYNDVHEEEDGEDDEEEEAVRDMDASSSSFLFTPSMEKVGSSNRSGKALWGKVKEHTRKESLRKKAIQGLLGGDITMPTVDYAYVYSSHDFFDDVDDGIDGGGEDIDSDDEEDVSKVSYYKKNSDDEITQSDSSLLLTSSMVKDAPKGFARVGLDRKNNVVIIKWLNPIYKDDVVDLESVMNRGTYFVPEDFPLSKAYNLFTLLGLRWIVVVGGTDGCTVVGMLTRESFLDAHIKEYTGVDVSAFKDK